MPKLVIGSVAQAAVSFNAPIFEVPSDSYFILTSAVIETAPGAAQFSSAREIHFRRLVGSTITIVLVQDHTDGPAGLPISLNWSGEVHVPPGWVVEALGSFNAGGVSNTVNGYCTGLLIPLGNIQRVG